MILDRENHVAKAVALAGTGNLVATDSIDLGPETRDIGAGLGLHFYHLLNGAAPAGGTSVEFQIIDSPNANMSSPRVLASTGAIVLADLPEGFLTFQPLPRAPGGGRYQRYLSTRLVRVGTFTGAAVWHSGITHDVSDFAQFYAATMTP